MRRALTYYVNTAGKWISDGRGGGANYLTFNCPRAAVRYFKAKPGRQLDVRGLKGRKRIRACWMYWHAGKVVVQEV